MLNCVFPPEFDPLFLLKWVKNGVFDLILMNTGAEKRSTPVEWHRGFKGPLKWRPQVIIQTLVLMVGPVIHHCVARELDQGSAFRPVLPC